MKTLSVVMTWRSGFGGFCGVLLMMSKKAVLLSSFSAIALIATVFPVGGVAQAQVAGGTCSKVGSISPKGKYRCTRKRKAGVWVRVLPTPSTTPSTTRGPSASDPNGSAKVLYGTTPCVFPNPQVTAPIRSFLSPFVNCTSTEESNTVNVDTNRGHISFVLIHRWAPGAVNNFVNLIRARYYDGTYLHRVVKDFVFQGGDPTALTEDSVTQAGSGGPGYVFDDELPASNERAYRIGDLLMANSGPNTNGSQFFVITGRVGEQIPRNYTRFGQLRGDVDLVTLNTINALAGSGDGPPTKPILIKSITVFTVFP
jgi:cyclophilin family peptidyl-prolyl cis-trans isomerase